MSLNYQIDSIEGLDESIAALYKKTDKGFVLDLEGAPKQDVSGLKSALEKEREARKNLEKSMRKVKDIDPDEYTKMAERIQAMDALEAKRQKKEAEKKGQWEKLEKDLKSEHQRQLEAMKLAAQEREAKLSAERDEMAKGLERHIGEKELIKAIASEKGSAVVLMPHVKGQIKVVKTDQGKYEPRVIDPKGNIRYGETGAPMTPVELIKEFKQKPEFQSVFDVDKKPGGSDSTGGKTIHTTKDNPWAEKTFNLTQQAIITKQDPAKAEALKQEAKA